MFRSDEGKVDKNVVKESFKSGVFGASVNVVGEASGKQRGTFKDSSGPF